MKHLKRIMRTAAALFAVLSIIFLVSHLHHNNHYSFACFITFLTCFYHFAYRILVNSIITEKRITFNYNSKWFTSKSFEEPLFKLFKVKRWKEIFPNILYKSPATKDFPVERLIQETCCSEVAHEINVLLSFVPFIVSLFYSSYEWIFLLSGLVAAAFDACFIIFHRHFRPRLIKLLNKKD